MRCAVSCRLPVEAGSEHHGWLGRLLAEPIEFVVVPDSGSRATRRVDFRNIEGVLLIDAAAPQGARGRDRAFDRTGRELVRFARARRTPVVGIGHWAEFLGLYFGGSLVPQPTQRPGDRSIDLRVAPGFGPPRATVHPSGRMHCDPKDFPEVLVPFAWDEHDHIAGFVHRDEPVLGIHWRPDDAVDLVRTFLMGRTRQPAGDPELNLSTG